MKRGQGIILDSLIFRLFNHLNDKHEASHLEALFIFALVSLLFNSNAYCHVHNLHSCYFSTVIVS